MELKTVNHSNKPMGVPDLKKTWISRNFRIQNIEGTLIPINGGYDQNEIKRNKGLNYFKQNCPI